MITNFFQNLASVHLEGVWRLVITTATDGSLTVSQLFQTTCGDKAVSLIVPLTLSGTAQELDEEFFDQITAPAARSIGLQVNLEAHLKSLEQAEVACKSAQEKAAAAKPVKNAKTSAGQESPEARQERRKNYEGIMKNIAALSSSCKYEDALSLLPSAEEYPEKQAELEHKRADLIRQDELLSRARLNLNN